MAEGFPRVLVVDDEPDLAEYIKALLEKRASAQVHVEHDGAGGVCAVRAFAPDLVITDIEMPGMSGLQMLEAVRRDAPGTPVIVVSAHASVDYALCALRAHADEFLTKPMDSATLVATVLRLAEEGRRRRGTAEAKETSAPR